MLNTLQRREGSEEVGDGGIVVRVDIRLDVDRVSLLIGDDMLRLDGIARDLHFASSLPVTRIQMVEREERMSKRQNRGYKGKGRTSEAAEGDGLATIYCTWARITFEGRCYSERCTQ
jgi:hypothetical protein